MSRARNRYLVVDRDAPDGDTPLPSGDKVKLVASFLTPELARALAAAEQAAGRNVVVIDVEWEETMQEAVRRQRR